MTVISVQGSRRQIRVWIGEVELTTAVSIEVGRDLADICGAFRVTLDDPLRDARAGFSDAVTSSPVIREHMPVRIDVAGETIFRGHVEELDLRVTEQQAQGVISGRDVSGDLVDCTGAPLGPGEYRQVTLATLVGSLVQPFGLSVDSDTDMGAPFTLVAVDPSESAMETIEKHARQRGVLVVSDGIGGLRLTKSGTTQAPAALEFPGNVLSVEGRVSVREHYSDVWVKGAFRSLERPSSATLSGSKTPSDAPLTASGTTFTAKESAATLRFGHAVDTSVGRWRPRVWLAATQSGGSQSAQNAGNPVLDAQAAGGWGTQGVNAGAYRAGSRRRARSRTATRQASDPWTLQDQADWRMRTTRAQGTARIYTVAGFDVDGVLWRPNTRVHVRDAYAGVDEEMLIGAVTYVSDEQGYRTRISVVRLDAYDLTGDEDHRRSAHGSSLR